MLRISWTKCSILVWKAQDQLKKSSGSAKQIVKVLVNRGRLFNSLIYKPSNVKHHFPECTFAYSHDHHGPRLAYAWTQLPHTVKALSPHWDFRKYSFSSETKPFSIFPITRESWFLNMVMPHPSIVRSSRDQKCPVLSGREGMVYSLSRDLKINLLLSGGSASQSWTSTSPCMWKGVDSTAH